MDNLSSWQIWFVDNTPLVVLAFIGLAGLSSKLLMTIIKERKDTEDKNVDRLVESIDRLVDRVDGLLERQEGHEERLGKIEGSVNAHLARCVEREKVLRDIQKKQTFHINKFNDAMVEHGGHRTDDAPMDRTDREN